MMNKGNFVGYAIGERGLEWLAAGWDGRGGPCLLVRHANPIRQQFKPLPVERPLALI